MGVAQSQGVRDAPQEINVKSGRIPCMTAEDAAVISKFPDGVDGQLRAKFRGKYSPGCMSKYTVLKPADPQKKLVQEKLKSNGFSLKEDKALGAYMGMVVGDALGAPLEFSPVHYGVDELKGMDHTEIWMTRGYNRFMLKPGQWTDDASMGQCIAESLLVHPEFSPTDLRLRFMNWWQFGYCNAFGYDEERGGSVGLGGNISQSMSEFMEKRTEYTTAGDYYTSGNGSVMRLAAVPVFFWDNKEKGMEVAYKQTINSPKGDKSFLDKLPDLFRSKEYSMQCLAASKQEEKNESNAKLDLADRNWNWKAADFKYAPGRSKKQPGYIGSYAMDALSMALHCVYTTESFSEAVLKCVNMRGDADSVGSVAAQIAGSIYGVSDIPSKWIDLVQQWDNNGDCALRAYRLFSKS